VNIVTLPGYLAMVNNPSMQELFRDNASQLVGANKVVTHEPSRNRGGSTDMGDLSHIMPVIHPYTTAATGGGHGVDYLIEDYFQAVINPAKAMAMTVIDLLAGQAETAKAVLDTSPPQMSKQQYLDLQNSRLTEEFYEGR
jgi:metal-dependent amidase/aminoacylase/carboxypeptidase family protein